jgi:hypothetical protein
LNSSSTATDYGNTGCINDFDGIDRNCSGRMRRGAGRCNVVHSWDENIAVVVFLPSSATSDDTEVAVAAVVENSENEFCLRCDR